MTKKPNFKDCCLQSYPDVSKEYKPGLYVVATPIGNLDDITIRALNTLKNSTAILCEDTRNTQKLLAKHNISAKLFVYNDHSTDKQRNMVARLIDSGGVVSLVSDAGTPLISDPGFKLIRHLKGLGYFIEAAPGASAPIAALTLSGLAPDRFLFAGFLPKTTIKKQKIFMEFADLKSTLIFFETASRLIDSLNIAMSVLGNRQACVARELTKLYQEIKTASLQELIEHYTKSTLKGEIVLLISGVL